MNLMMLDKKNDIIESKRNSFEFFVSTSGIFQSRLCNIANILK